MTSTALKLLALVLMFIDHVGEFIPGTPIWLRWIGRASAPLFFFCAAEGFSHTHDRKKYLLRLYVLGVVMALINMVCNSVVPFKYIDMYNDIFVTIFIFALIIYIIDLFREDTRKGIIAAVLFLLAQVAAHFVVRVAALSPVPNLAMLIGAVFGGAEFCEGGWAWVATGVLLYYAKDDKLKLTLTYLGVSLFFFVSAGLYWGWGAHELFFYDFQWMMVASLPFMLSYNGKRGAGLKYLFYVFYPAHIVLLFFAGNLLR